MGLSDLILLGQEEIDDPSHLFIERIGALRCSRVIYFRQRCLSRTEGNGDGAFRSMRRDRSMDKSYYILDGTSYCGRKLKVQT